MDTNPSRQFEKAFPVSVPLQLRGRQFNLAPPNFYCLAVLEKEFGEDWEKVLSRIDVRDRGSFVKLFTVMAQQTDSTITEDEVAQLIDLQNMWTVVDAMQEVIMKSQPDPELLKKLTERTGGDADTLSEI